MLQGATMAVPTPLFVEGGVLAVPPLGRHRVLQVESYKSSNKTFPSSSLRISSKEREAWSLLARSAASPLRRRSGKKRIFRLILSVGALWRARCRGARGRRFEPAM